jgi:hypothetical protein
MPPGRLYPCRSSELQMIIDGGKRAIKSSITALNG